MTRIFCCSLLFFIVLKACAFKAPIHGVTGCCTTFAYASVPFVCVHQPSRARTSEYNLSQLRMSAVQLSGKEKKALRSLAGQKRQKGDMHYLTLGHDEPTNGFLKALDDILSAHELVSVRMANVDKKAQAKEIGETLAEKTSSGLAQVIGHSALLYRPSKKPSIDLQKLMAPKNK
eukprot:CAMPEP_0113943364 /NCGR_PEP_ID=MMETSP1339-20121228/23208_1 /TAXON_ID=94617 /ORGANISM="Fibrocapsa japonica" /LENGTH=174 /DNA_ID=CAMNT_0000948213 /DNA_START=29 /DNA_END=553 /DNA_ORIENTATION=+ /assembly_acc=CAM_ASM_000762